MSASDHIIFALFVSSFLSFCVGIRSRRSLTTCIAGVGIRPHRSWRKNQIRRMGTFNPCLIVYYCSISFIFLILLVSVSNHLIFALFVSFVSSCSVGIRPCRSLTTCLLLCLLVLLMSVSDHAVQVTDFNFRFVHLLHLNSIISNVRA